MKHQARKRFGQNFLQDQSIIDNIVAAINPGPADCLVEIGPGLGALTYPVLQQAGQLDVIELDRDIIPHLQAGATGLGELRIHSHDALKFDFGSLVRSAQSMKVFGNLPYNISTPLIFHLFKSAENIEEMHFMLQKEVVDRMAANPGSKQYGRLSIMTQYYCQAIKLFEVPPSAFRPAPKVFSAIVRLRPYDVKPLVADDEKLLSDVVTTAFNYRRKTLRNALKAYLIEPDFSQLGLEISQRPEQLSVKDFVQISNYLTNK
ncbi:MAG: 16S rRNA (adenine(1518)-N(6)/adenine(1519)-N(6))-dimethyltransferase RsmA [Gammaproteobacteria bacterium]|nr:16S rRNA (adenine(1518)-N(6)/adenine(1519)-N(6))-dimethyltransferase RsmA [Gammaproteobacteria bacterium]